MIAALDYYREHEQRGEGRRRVKRSMMVVAELRQEGLT